MKTWENNLNMAVKLPVKHISAYSLILERGTILNKMVLDGKVAMTNENHDADMYKYTMDFLGRNNFNQYEVSNFALENYECNHNLHYWEYDDYLSLKKYNREIDLIGNAIRGKELLTKSQMRDEFILLALRSKGLSLDKLKSFSENWYFENKKNIDSFIDERYLEEKKGVLYCTNKGYMICDEIINKLL